jgi:hypothetical protein
MFCKSCSWTGVFSKWRKKGPITNRIVSPEFRCVIGLNYTGLTALLVAAFACGAKSVASVEWQRTKCVSVSHFASQIPFILIFLFRKKKSKTKAAKKRFTNYSHPRTYIVPAYIVSYQMSLFPSTHKFVNTMLQIFSSFWTSMINSSHSTFWFKFGSIAPLNKLRKRRIWAWAWAWTWVWF